MTFIEAFYLFFSTTQERQHFLKSIYSVYGYCYLIFCQPFSVTVPVSTVVLKKDNQAFNGAFLTVTAGSTVSLSCTFGLSRPSPPTIVWYIVSVK